MNRKTRRAVIVALSSTLLALVAIARARPVDPGSFQVYREIQPWSLAERNKLVQHLTDWGYFVPDEFHGEFINVDHDLRRTLGQPEHYAGTIYMFGNSTVFNSYLPDAYTLPSQIQALTDRYRVVNMGYDGATISVEYARLRTVDLTPNDIVIFYDGIVDGDVDNHLSTFCALDYAAREHVTVRGARFVHVLEPYLFSKPLSAYEQAIVEARNVSPAHYAIYPALRLCVDADLSHSLDKTRASGQEVFIDEWHISAAANGIVARAIVDVLFPIL